MIDHMHLEASTSWGVIMSRPIRKDVDWFWRKQEEWFSESLLVFCFYDIQFFSPLTTPLCERYKWGTRQDNSHLMLVCAAGGRTLSHLAPVPLRLRVAMVTRINTLDVGQVITINKDRSELITPPDNGGGSLLGLFGFSRLRRIKHWCHLNKT